MKRLLLCLLVAALGCMSPALGTTSGPTGTSGIPPLHNAYRLPVTADMPEWARLLYRSDIEVDVAEIDRAYARRKAELSAEEDRKWREPH